MSLIGSRSIVAPTALLALMLVMSSIPGVVRPGDPRVLGWITALEPRVQNVLHIPLYTMLAWLWLRYLSTTTKSPNWSLGITALICITFAVLEESYQLFIPGRYASLSDLIFDALGLALGLGLFYWSGRRRKNSGRATSASSLANGDLK